MDHDAEDQSYADDDYPDAANLVELDAEVSLLAVLEAYACTPSTPGDEAVIDSLASTGASIEQRMDAMLSAYLGGMMDEIEILANLEYRTCQKLSELGFETLEKLRFDERTRIASRSAREILSGIEKEMASEA